MVGCVFFIFFSLSLFLLWDNFSIEVYFESLFNVFKEGGGKKDEGILSKFLIFVEMYFQTNVLIRMYKRKKYEKDDRKLFSVEKYLQKFGSFGALEDEFPYELYVHLIPCNL